MPYLSNPLGLWALAAIPAILIIHTLQERSRRVRASTLFLLDFAQPVSTGGVRWERLRQSLPMWLQILAALLLAWVLVEPRWITEQSRQTVVVVLDSSVSMSAFHEELSPALAGPLSRWNGIASHTDWHLLQSDQRQPTLYRGPDLPKMLDALVTWEPMLGTHEITDSLNQARGLVKEHGAVLFVSDHLQSLPAGVGLISIGDKIDNVGWTGIEILANKGNQTATRWRATLHSYSPEPVKRDWWLEFSDAATPAVRQSVTLTPGQTITLEGDLPPGKSAATLRLSVDEFTWDDTLPFVTPEQQIVTIDFRLPEAAGDTLRKMIEAIDGVEFIKDPTQTADILVGEIGTAAPQNAILTQTDPTTELSPDWTIAEEHPLTHDLHWMGLLTPTPPQLFVADGDQPLLWKKDRILALIRHDQTEDAARPTQRLILNWNLAGSNAGRLPSMLIFLQRFIQQIRETKTDTWAANVETRQAIPLPPSPKDHQQKATLGDSGEPFLNRAPDHPGFFTVNLNGQPWLTAAARFADTREADFTHAETEDTSDTLRLQSAKQQTEADPWTSLYLLGSLAALIISWAVRTRRPATPQPTFLHPADSAM